MEAGYALKKMLPAIIFCDYQAAYAAMEKDGSWV